jgi:hypothetical protein
MIRFFLAISVLSVFIGCETHRKPFINSAAEGIIVTRADDSASADLSLLFIDYGTSDTASFQVLNKKDTILELACNTKYTCYYKYADESRYRFADTVDYHPAFCKEKLSFQQVKSNSPVLNYLIQDFKQGSIYRLGKNGRMINEMDSMQGFIRGFDYKDSLLVWCSDSSQLTIRNLLTGSRRQISFDSSIRIHHDLVLHYPYVSVLYKKNKYKKVNRFQVIEEGFMKIDLRNNDFRSWSIHDYLPGKNLPLENAKGNFVTAHSNSIDVDQNGDFYISFRDFSQVWKVSSDLSEVRYKLGMHEPAFQVKGNPFTGQHSIDIIKPNLFYLFDNGATGAKTARIKSNIVRISVDERSKTYEVKNILSLPDSLGTIRMGSAHALGANVVISTFNKGFHIMEIDTAGVIKNHLVSPRSHAIKVLPVYPRSTSDRIPETNRD